MVPTKNNPLPEAERFARLKARMTLLQRHAADYLNHKTATWNRSRQLLFLNATCFAFAIAITCMLCRAPQHALSTGQEHPPLLQLPPEILKQEPVPKPEEQHSKPALPFADSLAR